MTNDKEKEELRLKFIELWEGRNYIDRERTWIDNIFDFFYSEIEVREKELETIKSAFRDRVEIIGMQLKDKEEFQAKISHLESIIQAADEVIRLNQIRGEGVNYVKALDKYNNLILTKDQF